MRMWWLNLADNQAIGHYIAVLSLSLAAVAVLYFGTIYLITR